ncbi:MAG: thymidylate synthase [Phyllobacteriaceae bacterium]|jgi:thymidylate synthase|nr:thymidylate synthase [Phyllobacteriaceae bacterium]
MPAYRNISFAVIGSVRELLRDGANVVVKDALTKELIARNTTLEKPLERYLFVPHRHHDIAAQFAETMWVMAGRNDIDWLRKYLPRAPNFSDDGRTWRGGYGPRLRQWAGIDQIDAVRKILRSDRASRQAVMILFDPALDFQPSKDIPCNNWLSWIIRDNQLHMLAALRSNDVWWGFSGANAFEWSILHEMLAFWVEADVGPADYLATSFHLYEEYFERGERALAAFHGLTPYDFGVQSSAFSTPWQSFPDKLQLWFDLERQISAQPDAPLGSFGQVGDPLLDSGLTIVHVAQAHEVWGEERLARELAILPARDYVAALYEKYIRIFPGLQATIQHKPISDFFAAQSGRSIDLLAAFNVGVKKLHADKDRAYGRAWKKRGELVSIQPNIARKVDRLDTFIATGRGLAGESALDTAVDLVVYVEKYRLFLAESLPPGTLLPACAPLPLSDYEENFDNLFDQLDLTPGGRPLVEVVADINSAFDACWREAESGATVARKLELADALSRYAAELLAQLVQGDRMTIVQFLQSG